MSAPGPFSIVSIGGGPAGLYFAILMKQAFPQARITVHERNQPDDTFGWGVVFSDETLGHFEEADPQSYQSICQDFARWTDIETWHAGQWVRSTGHGFCGLSRRRLLQIFHARCRELGVDLRFGSEVTRLQDAGPADLVLAADGLQSAIRKEFEPHFRPRIDWRHCRFSWLGTTLPLRAFTFIFLESEFGLFQVHAYPFERRPDGTGLSTFIVECQDEVWQRAGLDRADEAQTVAFCERLFAEHLRGHRLLPNKSIWRQFPTIRCESWHYRNVVLVGDAAHTAHFSIGSGTKLAMEDAIALARVFRERAASGHDPQSDVPGTLAAYEAARKLDTLKTQRAAQTSLEWFENSARYLKQPPLQFTFNLMTRSKRITWENLRQRDPALVAQVDAWFAADAAKMHGTPAPASAAPPPPMFAPFRLAGLTLPNRVVVSPMCQYSAVDGVPGDWHMVHLGSRAVGGAGLVISEMTNVTPDGRITLGCTGLWNDAQEAAWARIVRFVKEHSAARIGIQLAHAGRKGCTELPWIAADGKAARPGHPGGLPLRDGRAWSTLGPSARPFAPGGPPPRAMTRADMDAVREAFVAAARRADRAGFELLELHMAHGYLLSSFLTPLANRRDDEYGGSFERRMRYPLEVFSAVRAIWPRDKALAVRVSATDWLGEEGQTIEDTVVLARALRERGLDLLDVSSGGNAPESQPDYGRMFQVPFADRIRHEVGVPVMSVGAIQGADHVNTVVAAGRADLCALARPHLTDPYITLHAAAAYGHDLATWPAQYLAVKPPPKT
ncbi:MAG: oxidoreductase [Planctomycetota bacterium]